MESPQGDPTTPGVRLPACACPRVRLPEQIGRTERGRKTGKTGRQGGHPDTLSRTGSFRPFLPRLPCQPAMPDYTACPTPPTLPRFPPFPRVSYCQQECHTRTLQNGLLSSHFTIFQSIKTLRADAQQLARQLNIMFII